MDALSLLAQAQEAGLAVALAGDKLVVRGPRRAEPMVRLIAEHKPAVIAALAAHWRARHGEALAHWRALHGAREAAALAWNEMLGRWHLLHGRRELAQQGAGCGQPIDGTAALTLADGNRVHLADSLDCLLTYGARWRRVATASLRALELDPPAEEKA